MPRPRHLLASPVLLWRALRFAVAALAWFVVEEGLVLIAAVMFAAGWALFHPGLGLIAGALSLVAVEIKTGVDWRARTG